MHKAAEEFKRFFDEVTAEGIHPHNIEMAYMAMVGHEKALKSCILEEQIEEEGYSGGRGRYTVRGEYSRDGGYSGGYEDGDSYRRRDSMGRYTRDGYPMEDGYSGRHWVRGHYSRDGKGDMMDRMRRMMEEASPEEREKMSRMMRNMEQA
jgi:hypothetical protein